MAAMLVGTVLWGLSARASAPALFNSSASLLGSSAFFARMLLAIVTVMAVATVLAAVSLARALLARPHPTT